MLLAFALTSVFPRLLFFIRTGTRRRQELLSPASGRSPPGKAHQTRHASVPDLGRCTSAILLLSQIPAAAACCRRRTGRAGWGGQASSLPASQRMSNTPRKRFRSRCSNCAPRTRLSRLTAALCCFCRSPRNYLDAVPLQRTQKRSCLHRWTRSCPAAPPLRPQLCLCPPEHSFPFCPPATHTPFFLLLALACVAFP